MHPFTYSTAGDERTARDIVTRDRQAKFLAGGTTLIDLIKLNVERPSQLVDIKTLPLDRIETHLDSLRSDAYLLDRFHAVASGGSSGQRGVYVYGWESWVDCHLSILRYAVRARMRVPELMSRPGPVDGQTGRFHTPRAYSRIVRSALKAPIPAMLRMALWAHSFGAR